MNDVGMIWGFPHDVGNPPYLESCQKSSNFPFPSHFPAISKRLWSLGFPTLLCSLWSDAFCGLFVAGALRWALVQHITFAVTWAEKNVASGDWNLMG
jgi:hypothetical protein